MTSIATMLSKTLYSDHWKGVLQARCKIKKTAQKEVINIHVLFEGSVQKTKPKPKTNPNPNFNLKPNSEKRNN